MQLGGSQGGVPSFFLLGGAPFPKSLERRTAGEKHTTAPRSTAFDPTMASPMCVGTSILDTGARKASAAGPAEAQAGVPGMFGLPNVANVSVLYLSCSVC